LVVRGEWGEEEEAASIFPTKIVLATDGSAEATLAVRTAADIATKASSELHIVYATPIPMAVDPASEVLRVSEEAEERVKREAQQFLDEQLKQVEAAGGRVTQSHARMGRPDEEIVTLADELGAGLIVIGSRGLGGIRRALMGSVSDSVVRHAHCPVMVVRNEGSDR
jgi:nucleotide-binding universal stress UspA family protein